MAQPTKAPAGSVDRAEQIVLAFEEYLKAYIARYVHMSTNDEPIKQARRDLADLLATVIK